MFGEQLNLHILHEYDGKRVEIVFALLMILAVNVQAQVEGTLYIYRGQAIGYLSNCLTYDEAYEDGVLDAVYFMIEWLDDFPDSTIRDYTDIALREIPYPGWTGTVDSLPLLDRFRVYADGRILYSSPIFGFLVPYEDFLEGRTDI